VSYSWYARVAVVDDLLMVYGIRFGGKLVFVACEADKIKEPVMCRYSGVLSLLGVV